jgi:hypothetical protein
MVAVHVGASKNWTAMNDTTICLNTKFSIKLFPKLNDFNSLLVNCLLSVVEDEGKVHFEGGIGAIG